MDLAADEESKYRLIFLSGQPLSVDILVLATIINPSHITGSEGSFRTSQSNVIRTAKPSKIAKPSGLIGPKSSTLPKSLSNEKICQASNLVLRTTKTLFQNRFGKAPESNSRLKMNNQKESNLKNVKVTTNQPTLARSDTYIFDESQPDTGSKIKPNIVQSVELGNNVTQNVMNKLQGQTFTYSSPIRMSLSPIASQSSHFAFTRKMSAPTSNIYDKTSSEKGAASSTPFRPVPINAISTKDLNDQKLLPPISFDITGTDQLLTTTVQINSNGTPNSSNVSKVTTPTLNFTQDIASTSKPQFMDECSTATSLSPPQEKFHLLAGLITDGNLITDTTLNLYSSSNRNMDMTMLNAPMMDDLPCESSQTDNSTIKGDLILFSNEDESRSETLVPLMPSDVEKMEIDDRETLASHAESNPPSAPIDMPNKQRFSFGQDMTEWTLDCSIELYDSSVGSSAANIGSPSNLKKQSSLEEKSLSILTPDQMKEFLDSNTTNLNLDLPLFPKMSMHQCRIDQTPSPEELPLDPVGVKTDICDMFTANDNQVASGQYLHEQQLSQTDSYSKTDQMTKSGTSKVSNSFITSVTSITSLDTGYQGDGEMSRPASRGGDHSPSNMPRVHAMRPIIGREPSFMNNNQNIAIVRRQDPMTDSDFFTESDADDIINRGDRRAQVIDGQLYAPMVQGASVYVNQQPSTEDSCMESSGIFTDVENRADEELIQRRHEHDSDMSPDGSTDTVKSSNTEYNNKKNSTVIQAHTDTFVNHQGHSMSDSTTSTINSSCEKGGDRRSVISDDSINSVHSIQSCDLKSGGNLQSSSFKNKPIKLMPMNRMNQTVIDNTLHSTALKQNKNEANVALKKHEMSKSKRVVIGSEKLRNSSSSGIASVVGDTENQENKRPTPTTGCSSRKVITNKWDAVMNKIATNKTTVKSKNYNEVKSKVTCGLTKKDSPGILKSPTNEADLFVPTSKRNFQLSSKRGRTSSQQSSQSDISENVASVKTKNRCTSSSSLRSAKKRDVRAISDSPNDLNSTKTNGKCGNVKPVTLQKRFSNGSTPTVSPLPTEPKSSPPPKKFLSKRSSQPGSAKTPLKDHNRLVGSVTTTTTKLQVTPRTIATSPKGTISPKTTQRVISHNSSHSIQNATYHGNGIIQTDGMLNNKAHTNANQIDRIVNNGKLENRLNGVGSTRNVITATKATSTIDVIDENLIHANKGVAALGVLVQYLAFDLDAFNSRSLKVSIESKNEMLVDAKLQLESVQFVCKKLENELATKDQHISAREKDFQKYHQSEISKVEARLSEFEHTTSDRIKRLETQIVTNDREFELRLQDVVVKMNAAIVDKEAELKAVKDNEQELLKRIRSLSLNNEQFAEKERNIISKLNNAEEEILVLRNSIGTTRSVKGLPMTLDDEIQSWRSVLEMKQTEILALQKRNRELENAAAALPGALTKISALESRVEDLEIQLKIKNEEEQELLAKNKLLEQSYTFEKKNRSLISLDNEQLKYRLKRNTEKYSSAITELMRNQSMDLSSTLNNSDSGNTDISPPTTPVIKGVVEKPASVSYVLEINDDESAEALASRIIRRAGSFRQSLNEKNHTANRTIQQGNALSQSASATSILRLHSEPAAHSPKDVSGIIRSKSVSTKSNGALNISDYLEENLSQNKRSSVKSLSPNKPISSSTPLSKRSTANSIENDLLLSEESETEYSSMSGRRNTNSTQYSNFRRSNSYKHTKHRGLITCNTAALTSQRPDLCLTLPVHPTVKELKKCQQIKESAGEAMVSGTNSEDEASTASSDGSLSSRSSSLDRRRSSIEDANIDKIVTSLGGGTPMDLGGTPMEVSWSEDVDHFASDAAV